MIQRVPQTIVDYIAEFTKANHHTKAYICAAKFLCIEPLVEKFEDILRQQIKIGHLPTHLSVLRDHYWNELINYAKQVLPTQEFEKLYMAM